MIQDIPAYSRFISDDLRSHLLELTEPAHGLESLRIKRGLQEQFPNLETTEALNFVFRLYDYVKDDLSRVLDQRQKDRDFIDRETQSLNEQNKAIPYLDKAYQSVIGLKDEYGRVVVGPLNPASDRNYKEASEWKVSVPSYLKGRHVTLFGPPDSPKMALNAMNAWHRGKENEPELISKLVEESGLHPFWGADDEDSKTPDIQSFLAATQNLNLCFDGTISFEGKQLEKDHLAQPIKRIPGLAIPDGSHFYRENPLPLHLVDFALHLFHNHHRKEALCFYIPKLENEEEASYLAKLIAKAEQMIAEINADYELGSIKLFIVFENPRAVFRIDEIISELRDYFVGGSLGWHDYLASAARLFKLDSNYRIPVKMDPAIVRKYIKESHEKLATEVQRRGGIAIGGMYGVLPLSGNRQSQQEAIIGFVKDVIVQMKRGLNGFWVAHPDFVRLGIALVHAWDTRNTKPCPMEALIRTVVDSPAIQQELIAYLHAEDIEGLSGEDVAYNRALLAADIAESDFIKNNDPREVRYNVFQAIQYIVDWLKGNGCVALPAAILSETGDHIPVRIMDDLATTERSRWEVWAEVYHGRFQVNELLQLIDEEISFIREGRETADKKVQVKWDEKWYPVAARLLFKLFTDSVPVEFAPELMLPFTFDLIRDADDPWSAALEIDPQKFALADEYETTIAKIFNTKISNHV